MIVRNFFQVLGFLDIWISYFFYIWNSVVYPWYMGLKKKRLKQYPHEDNMNCCLWQNTFVLRSSTVNLPLWPFLWSQPLTPADSLCTLSLFFSFIPSFLLVLLLDGWLAAQIGAASAAPGDPWPGVNDEEVKLMLDFITHTETPAVLGVIKRVNK